MPSDSLRLTAFHEAGHAVADARHGFTPAYVRIGGTDGRLGGAKSLGGWDGSDDPVSAAKYLVSLFAGYAAEVLAGGDPDDARDAARDDFDAAETALAFLGETTEGAIERARAFVQINWDAVQSLAEELLEHQRLEDAEIELIVAIADGEVGAEESLARCRRMLRG